MKKYFSFTLLVVAMAAIVSTLLSSCSYYDFDPESEKKVTDIPINLEVILDLKGTELPEDAFTITSPIKVIGLRQECGSYSEVFIEDAYLDDFGNLVFVNKHYWLKDRLMMFTAYWPTDAIISTDDYGRITGGNCVFAGHTLPMNPTIERKDHATSHDPLIIRAFNNPE